jgi:hypothetical protein
MWPSLAQDKHILQSGRKAGRGKRGNKDRTKITELNREIKEKITNKTYRNRIIYKQKRMRKHL